MRSTNDPYAKSRAAWPILRRMASRLYWTWMVLARLGLLERQGRVSRWLAGQFAQLEHGLRCMLVINAPRGVEGRGKLPIGARSSEETPARKFTRFSLTLGAFDEKTQQPPPIPGYAGTSPVNGGREDRDCYIAKDLSAPACGGSVSEADEGGRLPQRLISPEQQLAQRLNAIADVFADPDTHATRMARRIYARGWSLRAKLTTQPENRPIRLFLPEAHNVPKYPAPVVAATDTS